MAYLLSEAKGAGYPSPLQGKGGRIRRSLALVGNCNRVEGTGMSVVEIVGVSEISILERVAGGMLGMACGDALGAPAEYRSRDFIGQKWGRLTEMTGGGIWDPGEWTDDTGMALCMAEGILERPDDPVEAVGARLLAWQKKSKDVGESVVDVLDAYAGDWVKASSLSPASRAGRAAGNASLARTLPVALAYPGAWEMLTASARLSAMTHWDPRAEAACAVYCLWVDGILHGQSIGDAWREALAGARRVVDHGSLAPDTPGPSGLPDDFWERLENVGSLAYDDLQPGGYAAYVLDCLEAAAWCCLTADDLEEAVELAVNLGGDTDTLGALAGGVAGAYWGLASIPVRWMSALVGIDRLTDVARRLDELRRHHVIYSRPGVPPFEYYRVAENLHAGRAPLSAWTVRRLADLGVTHFVDLRNSDELEGEGDEALAMIEELGLRRAQFPVMEYADLSTLLGTVYEHLTSTMSKPESHVYVHARFGSGRTSAVLAAYVAAESMMSYDEVVDHLSDQLMKSSGTRIEPSEAFAEGVRGWLGGRN